MGINVQISKIYISMAFIKVHWPLLTSFIVGYGYKYNTCGAIFLFVGQSDMLRLLSSGSWEWVKWVLGSGVCRYKELLRARPVDTRVMSRPE